jgi:hypothetical protein
MTPLETRTTFTLLGLRFWDPAANQAVGDDLRVQTWPDGRPERKTTAFRAANGVYAFRGLPGLRHLEHPSGAETPWDPGVTPTRFVVEVTDRRSRFLSLAFAVDVPFRGIFPADHVTSPESDAAPGVWLFSAPTRSAIPALALVRAQLLLADPTLPGVLDPPQPAAYAVVALAIGGETWYGVSGPDGQVALFFPYPDFASPLGFDSPVTAMPPQTWAGTITVQYEPGAQIVPDGTDVPDVRSLFDQAPADVWLDIAGTTDTSLPLTLRFGDEPVLRTGEEATLWLTAPP